MNQLKQFFMKLIEPLTQVEFYQSLLVNILIIVAYILIGIIVITIAKKLVTKFFKANAKK
ncbi:mechanosensitive ion channel family protein, partial [bacterium M00.F.Ca.ET.163.01.1.1]